MRGYSIKSLVGDETLPNQDSEAEPSDMTIERYSKSSAPLLPPALLIVVVVVTYPHLDQRNTDSNLSMLLLYSVNIPRMPDPKVYI